MRVDTDRFPVVLSNTAETSRDPVARTSSQPLCVCYMHCSMTKWTQFVRAVSSHKLGISPKASSPASLTKVSFKKTPKMSTYLVAFFVGAFDYQQAQASCTNGGGDSNQAPPRYHSFVLFLLLAFIISLPVLQPS